MDELFLKKSQYRADIDGLRALAVISVVLYHFFPEILPGGFIGVDVFFVISGYLISLIIFSNIKKGTFSYKEFYTRRILRIFPSLCLVLIFTLSIGWFILDNNDYTVLGNEVIAGVLFLSNFNFASQAGYFDAVSISKPLLHLWSLGVEEQFYIFWPLIIVVLWNSRTNLLWVTFFILFTS
ncbi:MAG: acyltransferase, partial [bacterium]|nr:acyltransferase [bacterium]